MIKKTISLTDKDWDQYLNLETGEILSVPSTDNYDCAPIDEELEEELEMGRTIFLCRTDMRLMILALWKNLHLK